MTGLTRLPALFLGVLLICSLISSAQGLYKISTEEKVSQSSLIVEGKVVSQHSFWNDRHSMIYTANQIEVYKIFKGSVQKNQIEVVTVGGRVDNYIIQASHQLALSNNDIGVFFCRNSVAKTTAMSANAMEVYSSSQGFLKYNTINKIAAAPFAQFDDIEYGLYPELVSRTGRKMEVRNAAFKVSSLGPVKGNNATLAPAISSFSPATVNAGAYLDPANNVLTITGSGFGNSPSASAAVVFAHADYAPGAQFEVIEYNSPAIVSWTDTQIKVKVPSRAGSGTLMVRDNSGTSVTASTNLNVRFSILADDFDNTASFKQFNLGNRNGAGGYTVKYSSATTNGGVNINTSTAKGTFQRALNTWKESAGANITEGGTSVLQASDPDDGENMVMFDNGMTGLSPLASGVLATCYSGANLCDFGAGTQIMKTGFDIVIRNEGFSSGSIAFTFGPCPPYSLSAIAVDLETVLLHELGHALNLAHIADPVQGSTGGKIMPAKVMHFSVSYNQRRISLDYAARAGAEYQITPHGYSYGSCVPASPEMAPLTKITEPRDDCPVTFPSTTTPSATTVNFDLAHATSNKLMDPAYTQMTLDGSGVNITNNAFYAFRTNDEGGDLSLEIKNYLTTPVEIAACATGFQGVDPSGVKLSIYKVNGCPAGETFPLPVAYDIFKVNGVRPLITGLTANTNYLIVVDGVQNTKANFDLVLSGSSLVVLQATLSGTALTASNELNWTTDPGFNIQSMFLERSADGVNFTQLFEITGGARQEEGDYSDIEPLSGNNYYRLAITTSNGSVQYSDIVLLNRENVFTITLFPNPVDPVNPVLNVQILNNSSGNYGITLYNTLGQRVISREVVINGSSHVEAIYTAGLMRGIYYLTVWGPGKKKIKSSLVKLN